MDEALFWRMEAESHRDDHMDVWQAEQDTPAQRDWETWCAYVERLLGHDLDGNQRDDGYSMDQAYEYYLAGLTPEHAAARFEHSKLHG